MYHILLVVAECLAPVGGRGGDVRNQEAVSVEVPSIHVSVFYGITGVPWVQAVVNFPTVGYPISGNGESDSNHLRPSVVVRVGLSRVASEPAIVLSSPLDIILT